ncbi:MAG: right-handed parallel beta-helix repeat-containing protein [Propionibacteriaceae bacterium]
MVTLLVGALTALVVPLASAATPVTCGATLTSNTVLRHDLRCSGAGLTLAPGVSLDLGGHRLIGNGSGTAVTATEATATRVVNGTIRDWALGLQFESVLPYPESPLKLDRLRLVDAPLDIAGGDVRLDRSTLQRSALHLHYSALRARSTTLRSSNTDGELNQITLTDSTVVGGGVGLDENNVVTLVRSSLSGTGYAGAPVHCGGTVTVKDSTVRNYAQPIYAFADSCPLTVTGTTFRDNPAGAINAVSGGAGSVTVTGSTFRGNGVAVTGGGLDIRRSTFRDNEAGVVVTDAATSSITGSTLRDNAGSGISSAGTGLTVGGNLAVRNGGYGIYAPAANDLGGNRARLNALGQCVGLVCAP